MSRSQQTRGKKVVIRSSAGRALASGHLRPALPPEPIFWQGTGQTFIPATEVFAPSFDKRFRVVPRDGVAPERPPRTPQLPALPPEICPVMLSEEDPRE